MSGNDPLKVQSSCCPSNLVTLTRSSASTTSFPLSTNSSSSSSSFSFQTQQSSLSSVNTRKKRVLSSSNSPVSSDNNRLQKRITSKQQQQQQHMLTKTDHLLRGSNHHRDDIAEPSSEDGFFNAEDLSRQIPPPITRNNRKRTSRAYSIASLEEEEEETEEEEEEEEEGIKEDQIDEDLLLGLPNGSSISEGDKISDLQKKKEEKGEEAEETVRGAEDQEDMGPPSKRHKSSPVTTNHQTSSPTGNSGQPEMYSGNRISVIGQHNDNGGGGGGPNGNHGGLNLTFGDVHHGYDGNEGGQQLNRGGNLEARFLVSSRDAGAIIGRGGNNISHLRRTYDSSITVPDCPSPERVLTIVASLDRITKIVREILQFIETRPHALGAAPGRGGTFDPLGGGMMKMNSGQLKGTGPRGFSGNSQELLLKDKAAATEIRLLLHTSHAGGLIGKGGLRITQLREETHAGIKVYSECAPQSSERVCVVYGPLETVVYAVKEILTTITGFPLKGPNMLYDPRNYDQYLSPTYGGFSDATPSASAGTSLGHSSTVSSGGLNQLGMHHHQQQTPGGGHHQQLQQQQLQQRNPYFQSAHHHHQPPPPGLTTSLSDHHLITGGGSSSSSRGSNRGSNASFIPLGSSAGSRVGYGANNHHHQQHSGLLTPMGGRGIKGTGHHPHQMMMMDHPGGNGGGSFADSADLFAPDFGGTFNPAAVAAAAAAAAAQQGNRGGGVQWSNARSCSSSRRSSSVSNLEHAAGSFPPFAGGGGGAEQQEFDWLNHPDAAAKSWASGGGLAGGAGVSSGTAAAAVVSSKLFQQLLATGREDVAYGANMDGSASASISVPNKAVGAIIGRSGHRIGEIRSTSQAEISIGPNVPKTPTRLITVKGLAASVQTAVYLICKIVDENQ